MSEEIENGRDASRANMFISAVLRWAKDEAIVTVRDMSVTGAKIEGAILPPQGSTIQLVRGSLAIHGEVIWVSGRRGGLRFTGFVDPRDWLARSPAQAHVDARARQVKMNKVAAPSAASAPPPESAPSGLGGNGRWVDEIDATVSSLREASEILAADSGIVERHGTQLQLIDIAVATLTRIRRHLDESGPGK